MGSIELDSDITGDTFSLSMFTKGSERCSTGTCDTVASFAKASAREFSALGTCLN